MKNIYNIITEQKAFVDFNISKYDLEYTISQFENNEYYIQEGLGESIQNAGRKVIEFIKSIIKKIKEMISKFIDLIFGKKNRTGEINKEIQKINDEKEQQPSGGGGGGGSGDGVDYHQKLWDDFVDAVNKKNRIDIVVAVSLSFDAFDIERIKAQKSYIDKHYPEFWQDHKEYEFRPNKDEWDIDYIGRVQSDLNHNFSKERFKHLLDVTIYLGTKKGFVKNNINNKKENFKSTPSHNNTQVKKCKDVNELLSESKLLIQFEYFGNIEDIITICNDFFDNISKTVNDMKSARFYDGETAINTIIKRTFKKNAKDIGLVNDDRYSMEELEHEFKLHTGETSKTIVTVSVSSISKILLSYLERADDFAKYLRNKEKALVNDLEKLIKMLEDMSKERLADPNNEISSTNDKINTARVLSTLIANFVNIACRITAQRLNYTMQVVEKVKAEYAKN